MYGDTKILSIRNFRKDFNLGMENLRTCLVFSTTKITQMSPSIVTIGYGTVIERFYYHDVRYSRISSVMYDYGKGDEV